MASRKENRLGNNRLGNGGCRIPETSQKSKKEVKAYVFHYIASRKKTVYATDEEEARRMLGMNLENEQIVEITGVEVLSE